MPVDYSISWGDPNERLYDIEVRFTAPADNPELLLPTWRPGRYLIQNFAGNVREWSANRPVEKTEKSVWTVHCRRGEEVTFRYRYYAAVLDAGSSFLDPDEAYFNGSNLFMMVERLRHEPVRLTIEADPQWTIETQLPRVASAAGHLFDARDWDHLVDSPVIAARELRRHSFDEAGATIHLVFSGADGIDTGQFVDPMRAIVRYQAGLFGGLPFSEYRFLYHVADKWHGVEHEDSCSIILKREAMAGTKKGEEGYDRFLSISSHELFHVWNVKRMLPAAFVPYDFSRETPTRLLWAMEGMTSYFGELTLVRSGVWNEERYLAHLSKEITTYESSPARRHLSLAQASYDGWLQDPSRPHDRGNAWYSFYNKGEIVSALLDLTLRSAGSSLDNVVRHLWREYGSHGPGLPEDAIERAVATVAGRPFDDFFNRYVNGTEALPYEELLRVAGIRCEITPAPAALGAKLRASGGNVEFESVTRGGAAMAAGVLPGDELIAINDDRVTGVADAERLLRLFAEGDSFDLLLARTNRLRHARVTMVPPGSSDVTLSISEPGNALRDSWLGRTDE